MIAENSSGAFKQLIRQIERASKANITVHIPEFTRATEG
jgi:hypothetical protein